MGKFTARSFSGEIDVMGKAEDPLAWLEHFETVSLINGWEDDKLRLRSVAINLIGEAENWYSVNRSWINTKGRKWKEFQMKFIKRFRPANFQEELEERLRTLMMKLGESSRAYADRYRRLHEQHTEGMLTLDQCRKYWIARLRKEIKREVRIGSPDTFEAAIKLAVMIETADCADNINDARLQAGVKPKPQVKNHSADVAG